MIYLASLKISTYTVDNISARIPRRALFQTTVEKKKYEDDAYLSTQDVHFATNFERPFVVILVEIYNHLIRQKTAVTISSW